MPANSLKLTLRSLAKSKMINGINIIGLSVSMAAAILIIIWVQNELSFDNYHEDARNIYLVVDHIKVNKSDPSWTWETSPYLLGKLAQKDIPGVAQVASCYSASGHTFKINEDLFKEEHAVYVNENWFDMFKYDFVKGNPYAFNNSPYNLILTETQAKKYFGNTDPIGKTIRKDTINYTIQGIIKDNPVNSSFRFDMIMPLAGYLSNPKNLKNEEEWGNFNHITFVKLSEGIKAAGIEQALTKLIITNKKDSRVNATLLPLTKMHFNSEMQSSVFDHGNNTTAFIFEALAFLLLVIACINYVNLTTAKAGTRVKEVSIKKIVGAGKKQLFFQFMIETMVICSISLLITVLLLYVSLPFFNNLTEKHFILSLDSTVLWVILAGTLLISILLNGIYPALLLSAFKPLNIFKGLNMLKVRDLSLRKALVVTQFVISVFLIIGTIVIYNQLQFIQKQNSGYNRSQIFEIDVPYSVFRKAGESRNSLRLAIKQELLAQSSIERVSNISGSLIDFDGLHSGSLDWDGRDTSFRPSVAAVSADEDLQKMFNIQLTEGRWFQNGFNDRKNVLLNETAVNQFSIHKPVIGQRFVIHGDTGQIIGVVKDFAFRSMHQKIGPMVISNDFGFTYFIKTKAGQNTSAVAAAKRVWNHFVNNKPFDFSFLDDQFNKLYKDDLKASTLISIFASMAILISCLGLFGLSVFTAEIRVKEIGIRKVLGASLKDITSLLSRDFVRLVIIGIIIASPLAWWAMNKWLDDFAYRITISWWYFAAAALFALVVAICTISVQAIRAAMANPIKSLRTE